MPKYRPIIFDYIAGGRPSPDDLVRQAVRELPYGVPAIGVRTAVVPVLEGVQTGGTTRLKGGTFEPRATSGML